MPSWLRIGGLVFLTLLTYSLVSPERLHAESYLDEVSLEERGDGHGYVIRFHARVPVQGYREPQILEGGIIQIVLLDLGLAPGFLPPDSQGPFGSVELIPEAEHLVARIRLQDALPLAVTVHRSEDARDLLLDVSYLSGPAASGRASDAPDEVVAEEDSADEARRRWQLDTVVIDAGHGGRDAGATAFGIREKDVTFAVARRLGRYIEERLGCRVVYTRDSDRFVALHERGRIANTSGGKLFVSIHANAAHNGTARGTETYFLGMHKSEAARDVMERENGVVEYESDPDLYSGLDERSLIMQSLAQSAYMHKSEELAGLVEDALQGLAGRSSRGVKQAGFYVLWSASMPSVLVELGFITNRHEAAYLASEHGQDDLASAIFRAIRDFKEQYERELDLVESR